MTTKLICIECPKSCVLSVDIENCRVIKVSGQKCPKGDEYAVSEVENPVRVLTSAVLTEGLFLKMAPVRTDKPIPKFKLLKAMDEVKKIRLRRPIGIGDIVVENFLRLGVNLIATREVI